MSLLEGRSDNRNPSLIVLSNANNGNPVPLWADPTTHRLLVDTSISSAVITDIEDGAGDSVMDAANNSIKVTIAADSVGIGGGTQYTEDAAAAANPVGNALILVRTDTPATQVTTDGDNVAQRGTNYGAAYVQLVTSAGAYIDSVGGGTQYTEADTDASITGTAIMWEDTSDTLRAVSAAKPLPVSVQNSTIAVTQSGTWDEVGINDSGNNISVDWAGTVPPIGAGTEAAALRVTLATNSTGVVSVDDNGSSLTVDGTVAVSSITTAVVPGTGATNLGKAEDGIHASGDTGVMALAVRDDTTPAVLSGADGDYEPLHTDGAGNLWVSLGTKLSQSQDAIAIYGSDDGGTTMRIVETDSGGAIAIQDGGNTITVDGTLTSAGNVTNAGTFVVQENGSALTALQLIDDAVYVDDADWTDSTSKHLLVGGLYQSTPQTITDGDVGPLSLTSDGALRVSGSAGVTEYNEDDATPSPIVGNATLIERDDQLATVTPVEGDWIGLRGTSKGALWVALADASGDPITSFGGGTEYTEDVATADPQVGKAIMMERDDALSSVTPIEGDWIGLRGTAEGALWTQDFNSDAILADTASMDTNLGTVAGAVSGTEMQVDIVSGNVTNAGTFAVQVDGSALTALQLIDDIVYVDDADWTDSTSKHALVGGLYQSTPQTVTDGDVAPFNITANGALHVSDAGGSLTVDGTITANLSATDNTVLDNIDADTSAIQTATELIDDTVFVDDADWTADTSKHLLVGGVTQVATTANTDGDVTPLTTNGMRELRTAVPESDLATAATAHVKKYYTNAGAVTDGIIWSPAAGKRWFVTDIFINVSAAATITLEDDLSGGDSAIWKAELAANSGWSHSFTTPWFSGEDAADLIITTSAGNVYCTVVGYEI